MKVQKRLLSLLLLAGLLASCTPLASSSSVLSISSSSISSSISSSTSTSSSSVESSSTSSSSSSSSVPRAESSINLFTVNDTHGALEDGKFSKIAAYFSSQDSQNSLFLSAGDMFQGTALSNYTQGHAMIRAMNAAGFDAMTIGNHEFDWGLEAIQIYWDGEESNGEADFPLLGANVYAKATNQRLPWLQDYEIFEREGLKIGVIGVIGNGLESSIAYPMVQDYEFKNPVPIVQSLARTLREDHDVNIIVVNAHDGDSINDDLLDLSGLERVDAVVNGHVHQRDSGVLGRSPVAGMAYVQAGSSASHVGRIQLTYRFSEERIITAMSTTYSSDSMSASSATVNQIIAEELEVIAPIIHRPIGSLGETFTRNDYGYDWTNDVLYHASGAEIAYNNYGGVRAPLWDNPYPQGMDVKVSDIYTIVPFDNSIILVSLTKVQIEAFLQRNQSGIIYSSGFYYDGDTAYLDGNPLQSNRTYRVATLDYLFDEPYNLLNVGTDVVRTGVLFRDLLIQDVETATTLHGAWYPSMGSMLSSQLEE